MAQAWFYLKGGNPEGPITAVQLKSMADAGQITEEDLVWKEGLPHWIPAKAVRGLIYEGGVVVPPPPPAKSTPEPPPPPSSAFPGATPSARNRAVTRAQRKVAVTASSGLRPLAPIVVGVACLVVVLVALFWFLTSHAAPSPFETAAGAPQDALCVISIHRPAKSLADTNKQMDELGGGNAQLQQQWTLVRTMAGQAIGFDPVSVRDWEEAGFDLARPWSLAVLALDRQTRAPTGIVMALGLKDERSALDTVRRIARKANQEPREDDKSDPKVTLLGNQCAAAVKDERLFLIAGPAGTDKAEEIREFLRQAERMPLRAKSEFKTATGGLPTEGDYAGYVSIKPLLGFVPPGQQLDVLGDLTSLAFAGGQNDFCLYLPLSSGGRLLRHLQPGAAPGEFLKKLDPPLAAMTLSLADPVAFVRYAVGQSGQGGVLVQLESMAKDALGMNLDELGEQLKNGCAGFAMYPAPGQSSPLTLAFVRAQDRAKAARVLEQKVGAVPGTEKVPFGENVLYVGGGSAAGLIGSYVVVGNATQQITDLAAGKTKGWRPNQDPGLLYGEMDLSALQRQLAQSGMPQLQGAAGKLSTEARLVLDLARREDGVLLSYKFIGSSSAFAAALLSAGGALGLPTFPMPTGPGR